jgi:hypothetical protein
LITDRQILVKWEVGLFSTLSAPDRRQVLGRAVPEQGAELGHGGIPLRAGPEERNAAAAPVDDLALGLVGVLLGQWAVLGHVGSLRPQSLRWHVASLPGGQMQPFGIGGIDGYGKEGAPMGTSGL